MIGVLPVVGGVLDSPNGVGWLLNGERRDGLCSRRGILGVMF